MSAAYSLEEYQTTTSDWTIGESKLSICLRTDGFSFSIIDNRYNLCSIGRFQVDFSGGITDIIRLLRDCFSTLKITMFRFASVSIILPTEKQTWIPFKLYDALLEKTYLKAICDTDASETILSNNVPAVDAVSILAAPMSIVSGIQVVMPSAVFVSSQQRVVEYAYQISIRGRDTVLLHKCNNKIDIVVFSGTHFLYANTFQQELFNDFLYYLLLVLKQLKMETDRVGVFLLGDAFAAEEETLLRHFLKSVQSVNFFGDIHIPDSFDKETLSSVFLLLE